MAKAYSLDLRIRALALIKKKTKNITIVQTLNVSRVTLYRWMILYKKNENVQPKSNWQKGHNHKIKDLEAFRKFVEENSGLTLKKMAEKLGDVSFQTLSRKMKLIGYTSKKKPFLTKNAMNQNVKSFKMSWQPKT